MMLPGQPKWWTYSYHLSDGATWSCKTSFNTMGHTIDAAIQGALNHTSHGRLQTIDIQLKIGGDTKVK